MGKVEYFHADHATMVEGGALNHYYNVWVVRYIAGWGPMESVLEKGVYTNDKANEALAWARALSSKYNCKIEIPKQ